MPGGIDVTFHEPMGVVGVVVPRNFPMPLAAWGFAPALASRRASAGPPTPISNAPRRRRTPRSDPGTAMGPLISARHREKVTSYVDEEAAVAFRGTAPRGPGFWFPPTVLAPVAATSRQWREETFGPVTAVLDALRRVQAVRTRPGTRPGRRRGVHRD